MKKKFLFLMLFFVLASTISFFVKKTNKKEIKTETRKNHAEDLPKGMVRNNPDQDIYVID